MKKVDELPIGPRWKCQIIKVMGDRVDEEGQPMEEHLELWHRNPIDCVDQKLVVEYTGKVILHIEKKKKNQPFIYHVS